MSIIPVVFNDFFEDFTSPKGFFDHNFSFGFCPELINPHSHMRMQGRMPVSKGHCRPCRHTHKRDSGTPEDNEFKVNVNVKEFNAENLNVKVVDNNLIIEGKHEERQDEHGFISRQFTRRYVLPEDVDPKSVASSLSSDGVLTVTAPKKVLPPPENERVIPIVQTQQPSVKGKSDDKAGGDTEKMEQ